jgi:hypothetical protein
VTDGRSTTPLPSAMARRQDAGGYVVRDANGRGCQSCAERAVSRRTRTSTVAYFGFHSRASFWASAICAGVNCAATIPRAFTAFLFLLAAAKLNHMCAAA